MSLEPPSSYDDIAAADDRTLRLAVPLVTPKKLEALIGYQRAWVAAAEKMQFLKAIDAPSALHGEAVKETQVEWGDLAALDALCRSICGVLWTFRTLERKQAEAAQRGLDAEKQLQLTERTRQKGTAVSALARRYGAETVAKILEREDELVHLHEQREAALRRLPLSR